MTNTVSCDTHLCQRLWLCRPLSYLADFLDRMDYTCMALPLRKNRRLRFDYSRPKVYLGDSHKPTQYRHRWCTASLITFGRGHALNLNSTLSLRGSRTSGAT